MPITGKTPDACFKAFAQHMRKLATATVSKKTLLALVVEPDGHRAGLRFRDHGSPVMAEVKTKHGKLYFSLAQELQAVRDGKQYRLSTRRYWYRLQESSALDAQALIRWEYEISNDDGPAPHHVQSSAKAGPLDLNRLHVPTGKVMVEDVIRFLIVDLQHKPPCGIKWPAILEASARDYFSKFASHQYKRPDRSS